MPAEIDPAADRVEEQALLALAELLMAGLVFGRDDVVGLGERAVGVQRRMMDAQRIGARVRIVVGGTRGRTGALVGNDRHRAVRPHHVFDEMRGLADHRPPRGLVPADRPVVERDVEVAVVVHRRRDLVGEPGADRVHGDGSRARHLAHDVDVVDAAIDDRRGRPHEILVHLPERAGRLLVEVHAHHQRLAERPANLDEARP